MARILEPALDRLTPDAESTQLVVLTPDTETAVAIADTARSLARDGTSVVAITAPGRGARLMTSRVRPAIAATPSTLVAMLRNAAVKLDGVRTVIIAWADELFEAREGEALEVLLAEIPKDASRIVVADHVSTDVEALVERHLRRASRQGIGVEDDEERPPLPLRYVTTTAAGRIAAFRRLLDELDPPSVVVVASDSAALDEARRAVASFGYEGDTSIRVESEPIEEQAALVVFYDLPLAAAEVAKVAATEPAQVVALVTPRQVPALRRLTSGPVEPLDVSRATAKARARDERIRAMLRAELQGGFPARELMALEPLLSEFDGVEIAAAALRLFERERAEERTRRVETERPVERVSERPPERSAERGSERSERRPARDGERAPTKSDGAFTRVFLSIGERDGVRAGDLVGAITGESGITSDRIGKLEIRDGHTVAEIASGDAETVIEKMTGVTVKGRRISARIDDRPPRAGGREGRREVGPRRGGPGEARRGAPRDGARGPREGARGSRDSARGPREEGRGGFGDRPRDRGPRAPGRDRDAGERRPRGDDGRPRGRGAFRDRPDEGRVPRAAHERAEWSERADRVRNARRPRRDET